MELRVPKLRVLYGLNVANLAQRKYIWIWQHTVLEWILITKLWNWWSQRLILFVKHKNHMIKIGISHCWLGKHMSDQWECVVDVPCALHRFRDLNHLVITKSSIFSSQWGTVRQELSTLGLHHIWHRAFCCMQWVCSYSSLPTLTPPERVSLYYPSKNYAMIEIEWESINLWATDERDILSHFHKGYNKPLYVTIPGNVGQKTAPCQNLSDPIAPFQVGKTALQRSYDQYSMD